jgi:hypothetical protein
MNFRYLATIVLLPSLIWTGYLNGTGRIVEHSYYGAQDGIKKLKNYTKV